MKKLEVITEKSGLRFNNITLFADGDGAYELSILDADGEPLEQTYIDPLSLESCLRVHQHDLRKWHKFSWD